VRAPARAIVPALLALLLLAGCGTGGAVATPFTVSYPPASSAEDSVPISLIDQVGIVAGVAAAPDAKPVDDVEAVPGSPMTLRIRWVAGECVDRVELVLNSVGATYELAIHDHEGFSALMCTDATTPRVVDITFNKPLEPSDLALRTAYP
jgi:hypothetical protein